MIDQASDESEAFGRHRSGSSTGGVYGRVWLEYSMAFAQAGLFNVFTHYSHQVLRPLFLGLDGVRQGKEGVGTKICQAATGDDSTFHQKC